MRLIFIIVCGLYTTALGSPCLFWKYVSIPALGCTVVEIVMYRMWLRNSKNCSEKVETRVIADRVFSLYQKVPDRQTDRQTDVELHNSPNVPQVVAVPTWLGCLLHRHSPQSGFCCAYQNVYTVLVNFRKKTPPLLAFLRQSFVPYKGGRWLRWMTSSVQQNHFKPIGGVNESKNHDWRF